MTRGAGADPADGATDRVELPLEAEEFLVWLSSERGRSRNTIQAYRRDLLAYERWLRSRERTILTVANGDLVDLVAERRTSGAATSSVARQIAAIRMLHRYLAVEQVRPDDPTARLDGVRVPSGIPKPLTEAQVTSLLDAVDRLRAGAPSRPCPARAAVRHRGPHLRGRGAVDGRHRLRRLAGAPVRQGVEGAHRAVRHRRPRPPSRTGSRRRGGRTWCRCGGSGAATPRRCS